MISELEAETKPLLEPFSRDYVYKTQPYDVENNIYRGLVSGLYIPESLLRLHGLTFQQQMVLGFIYSRQDHYYEGGFPVYSSSAWRSFPSHLADIISVINCLSKIPETELGVKLVHSDGSPPPNTLIRTNISYLPCHLMEDTVLESTIAAKRMPYPKYLATDHWRIVRREAIIYHGNMCSQCQDKYATHVHHLNYEYIGAERVVDVQPMCGSCHREEHGK